MTQTSFSLSTIAQIAVPVKDIDRAVAFYRHSLGMTFLFQAPPALAFFDAGGIRLMLDVPEDKVFAHPSSIIYFKVPDIQAVFTTLQTRGVVFHGAPHPVAKLGDTVIWMAFFDDTEGNTHAITSEVGD